MRKYSIYISSFNPYNWMYNFRSDKFDNGKTDLDNYETDDLKLALNVYHEQLVQTCADTYIILERRVYDVDGDIISSDTRILRKQFGKVI